MRRALIAGLLLLAACAGPKPCTRTLCVTRLDGEMELSGWKGSVRATSVSPKPPVMSDAKVRMVSGTAEFRHGKTSVAAVEGAEFTFTVSSRSVSAIEVSAGSVFITPSTGPITTLTPGAPFALPKP